MAVIFPPRTARRADLEASSGQDHFDVAIIGSGIAGSNIAKQLAGESWHVLVVEAAAGIV
jgi:choline dehydrogenase-like flavoprotein